MQFTVIPKFLNKENWEIWNGYGPNDDNSDVPECEIEIIERNKKIFKERQDKPWSMGW